MFIVALDAGLRYGDLVHLKWSSIDFSNGGMITVDVRKTGARVTLPMSDLVRWALRACAGQHDDYVFVTERGLPYDRSTLRRYFAKAKSSPESRAGFASTTFATRSGPTRPVERCRHHDDP